MSPLQLSGRSVKTFARGVEMGKKQKSRRALMAAVGGVVAVGSLDALAQQVTYNGGTYTQNFDGMTNTTAGTFAATVTTTPTELTAAPVNGTGLTGWFAASAAGTPTYIY